MQIVNQKNMIRIVAAVAACVAVFVPAAKAQQRIITAGKIEYEKKVNMHKWMGSESSWTQELKDRMPEYRTTYFDLLFDSTTAVYRIGREASEDKWKGFWGQSDDDQYVVHQDFSQGTTTARKQVFEKRVMLQDSLLRIEWRITDDTRKIAGFECRKAVGRLFDTLYVVAFFTDQVITPAGPEQYHGLPGTILGLAFPRYYTTWFATRVEAVPPKKEELLVPSGKATRINRQELLAMVKKAFDWGSEEEKQRGIWNMVL